MLKRFLYYLPRTTSHKIIYWLAFRKPLDLKDPKDLNQVIHWLIIYKYGEKEALLYDKYKVKEYLTNINIKELNVAKLYAVFSNVNEIDLAKLPEKFVLKTSHGCGQTYICDNKANFDINKVKKNLKKSLKTNFEKNNCEYFSINTSKVVICEEYIDDFFGINPIDYMFYCIKGEVICIFVNQKGVNGFKRYDIYNTDWQILGWYANEIEDRHSIEKPPNFEQMLKIAKDLSQSHNFVRVDLYNASGKIYFGEFTFTPVDGLIKDLNQKALDYLGNLVKAGGLR